MKLSKDELLAKVKNVFGDSTDETYISLLEDIADSMEDTTQELTETIEKLTQELAETKQKYIDRFFTTEETKEPEEENKEDETEDIEDVTISDLFEEDKKDGE